MAGEKSFRRRHGVGRSPELTADAHTSRPREPRAASIVLAVPCGVASAGFAPSRSRPGSSSASSRSLHTFWLPTPNAFACENLAICGKRASDSASSRRVLEGPLHDAIRGACHDGYSSRHGSRLPMLEE